LNSSYINFNKSMAQVIIAENVNSPNEETYKNTIEMIDVNTILFNIWMLWILKKGIGTIINPSSPAPPPPLRTLSTYITI